MFQIAIVSGKGGTGKTTLAGSLSFLFDNHAMADCDVDAPNLHLLMETELISSFEYYGGKKAVISNDCISCGVCEKYCRFDALIRGGPYRVDPYACEGCGACIVVCPAKAITLRENKSGDYYLSRFNGTPLVHALLYPGEETSGGLVAEVRKLAIAISEEEKRGLVIIDGAPGIGCPATSSITGVSYVVVVSEPTVSGLHDLERIIETVRHFRRDCGVVINKCDINREKTSQIENWCGANRIQVLGKILYDEKVGEATMLGVPVVSLDGSGAADGIREIKNKLENIMISGGKR
ncbi:MAG TPA: ATP-binding protein [Mesotoga sp.]|nr:ATP-binding protein [Mesotoga sp.]MDI9374482.1 ATP-binding protein [Thermotogota bacterium]NLX33716.1 4Fe-4S binding protein [Thermotogaceae bacterium]MDD4040560.1 ATP-binding protein [Mesotoga sp.]MDD4479291.1 ATP-binding protein [Mesotoga sp.]